MDTKPKTAYIVATCDTKLAEASYVRDCIAATGIPTKLVDVGIKSTATEVDVDVSQVAAHHPNGPDHVFGDDRGKAIIGMAEALKAFMSKQTDVAGMVGLGGSGGTGIAAPARAKPGCLRNRCRLFRRSHMGHDYSGSAAVQRLQDVFRRICRDPH